MSDFKITDTLIENAYFHWGNGGLSFRVTEHQHDWTSYEGKPRTSVNYVMEVSASHHGAEMKSSFDLGSMEIVGWLHEMTGRLLNRMSSKPDQARGHIFNYHPQGRVGIEDGEKKSYHFRFIDGKVTPVNMKRVEFSGPGIAGVTTVEEGIEEKKLVDFISKVNEDKNE